MTPKVPVVIDDEISSEGLGKAIKGGTDDLAKAASQQKSFKPNSKYDRPEVETYSGKAVRPQNATDDWDKFLGDNQTDIDPFTGQKSPDRIWSSDGTRSVRFGEHEMNGMGTKNFHYHLETWYDDYGENVVQRVQKR